MKPHELWLRQHSERVVKLAEQILDGKAEIAEASYELYEIGSYLSGSFEMYFDGFEVFAGIRSELERHCVPRGEWRSQWNREALAAKDKMKYEIEEKYRVEVIKACHSLINQHGTP